MSINSEIARISGNVASVYAYAADNGADMPTQQNSDNMLSTLQSLGGRILFESADGDSTSTAITLSDDVSNYNYIEIIYGTTDGVSSAKALSGQTVAMAIMQSDADCFKITTGVAALSGTQLTRGSDGRERQLIINHATEGQLDFTGSSSESGYYISIYRVIGYK